MNTRSYLPRLHDMKDAIDGMKQTVSSISFEEYAASWIARRAVERGIEIVSEASRHLPAEVKSEYPGIPWQEIAAIGNVLCHEYQQVEDKMIWNVAIFHLSPVQAAVEKIIKRLEALEAK